MVPGQALGRVAAYLYLIVAEAQAGEILGKAFVEPLLGGRLVEIQKQARQVMGDSPPTIFSSKVEDDIVAVVSRQKKSRSGNRLALPTRRHANVFLVRLQGDHIQWFWQL